MGRGSRRYEEAQRKGLAVHLCWEKLEEEASGTQKGRVSINTGENGRNGAAEALRVTWMAVILFFLKGGKDFRVRCIHITIIIL